MPALISSAYSSLSVEDVQAASALSEQKMLTLISDAAWLEEGLTARPYNGVGAAMGNRLRFDHTGDGSGAYLRCSHTLPRGMMRDAQNPDAAITLTGGSDFKPLKMLQWSFEAAPDFGMKDGAANWRVHKTVPFVLHEYAVCLRWRVALKRTSGSGALHLRPAIYEQPTAEAAVRIAWGEVTSFEDNAWQAHEIVFDLDGDAALRRRRREGFPKIWYAALLARADSGCTYQVGDNLGGLLTWPGFAVTTP